MSHHYHWSCPCNAAVSYLSLPILLYCNVRYQGHLLAKELVARGLQTTVITDSAVFAMISRVNMVRACSILPNPKSVFLVTSSKKEISDDMIMHRL